MHLFRVPAGDASFTVVGPPSAGPAPKPAPSSAQGPPMARGRQLVLTELASADPDEVPDLHLVTLEEYDPPPLTQERLTALARRRAAVAATGVPEGLRG